VNNNSDFSLDFPAPVGYIEVRKDTDMTYTPDQLKDMFYQTYKFEDKYAIGVVFVKTCAKSYEDSEFKKTPGSAERLLEGISTPEALEKTYRDMMIYRDYGLFGDKFFTDVLGIHGNSITTRYMIELLEEALSA